MFVSHFTFCRKSIENNATSHMPSPRIIITNCRCLHWLISNQLLSTSMFVARASISSKKKAVKDHLTAQPFMVKECYGREEGITVIDKWKQNNRLMKPPLSTWLSDNWLDKQIFCWPVCWPDCLAIFRSFTFFSSTWTFLFFDWNFIWRGFFVKREKIADFFE